MEYVEKLRKERAEVIREQRALLDKAADENRELDGVEESKYVCLDDQFESLNDKINELENEKRHVSQPEVGDDWESLPRVAGRGEIRVYAPGTYPTSIFWKKTDRAARQDLHDFLTKGGRRGLSGQQRQRFENRALQADLDPSGGYIVAPSTFSRRVVAQLMDLVYIRNYATIIECKNSASFAAGALDNDPDDSNWQSEIGTVAEDSAMDFESRNFSPHDNCKLIKVSRKLIRLNPDAQGFIQGRFAYKFGITEERAFLTGDGANKPLGVLTASSWGISTSRDTSSSVGGSVKADDLIDLKYSLKAQYRKNCRWICSRDFVKRCRKLKDGEGSYLWRQGISSDRPDTILDLPFHESEYFDSWASNTYQAILGDFSNYWIVDGMDFEIQVLSELFARNNQFGYIGRRATDGNVVDENAFARLKIS